MKLQSDILTKLRRTQREHFSRLQDDTSNIEFEKAEGGSNNNHEETRRHAKATVVEMPDNG